MQARPRSRVGLWWAVTLGLVGCAPARPTPPLPFADIATADSAELRLACNDPRLSWAEAYSAPNDQADGQRRLRLVPEAGAHLIPPESLDSGRVILKLVVARGSVPFHGARLDAPDSACIIVSGSFPKNLRSRIVRFDGIELANVATGVRTLTRPHERPEANWVEDHAGFDSAGMLPIFPPGGVKAMQGGCTPLGCCKPRKEV